MTKSTGLRATISIALLSACGTYLPSDWPPLPPDTSPTDFCAEPDTCNMPGLARQTVPVVFKGLSQKSPDTIAAPGELKTAENQYVRHGGPTGFEFVKRHGLTTLATLFPASGYRLEKYNGGLVARGSQTIAEYSPALGTLQVPVSPSTGTPLINTKISRTSFVVPQAAATGTISPAQNALDIAYVNDTALYVWSDPTASVGAQALVYDTKGAFALKTFALGTTVSNTKCVALGGVFYVFYKDTNAIVGVTINATTLAVTSPVTVVAAGSALAGTDYDIQVGWAANRIAILYRSDASHNVRALLDTSFAVVTSVSDATAANQPDVGLAWLSQSTIVTTTYAHFGQGNLYYLTVNSSNGTKLQTINNATLAITATASSGGVTAGINFTGLVVTGIGPIMFYETTSAHLYNHRVNSTHGGALLSVGLASKVFFVNDASVINGAMPFVMMAYNSDTSALAPQNTYFISQCTVLPGAPVAKILPGSAGLLESGHVPAVALDTSGRAHLIGQNLVSLTSSTGATLVAQYGISDITFELGAAAMGTGLDFGGVLTIPGGITSEFDANGDPSSFIRESGFSVYPEPVTLVNNGAATGSMAAGTYSYVQTYDWVDRTGQVGRSAPSTPVAVTVAAATSSVTVTGVPLRLSQRPFVRISYWRTPANGTGDIYYKVTPAVFAGGPGFDTQTFADTISDATLAAGEPLYTSSAGAGELPHVSPPAFNVLVEHKGRAFGVSSEDPNIVIFSNPYVPGDAVSYNLASRIVTPIATGAVTAMASMDGHLILFKRDAVYVVDGDFPDPTGGGPSIPDATPNPAAFGTVDPNSIVFTDLGLIYHSTQNGFWLLDRSLTTSYIGANIDDTARGVTVTSAVLTSDETQARFTTTQGTTFVLDLYFARQGTPIWTTWTGQAAVGAVNLAGAWYLLTAAGVLKKEDTATFADDGVAYVRKLALTDISFAGINGFYRVWRGHLLGEWKGAHVVHMTVVDSRIPANVDTFDFDATTEPHPYEFEFRLKFQKGTSKTVTITDGAGSTTEGSAWTGLSFLVGAKTGLYRLPQTLTMTPS